MGYTDQQRSGRHRAIARVNGKRVTVGTYDFAYEAELAWQDFEAKAAATTVSYRQPTAPAASGATVAAYGWSWLERRRGALTTATRNNHAIYLRFYDTDPLGALPIAAIVKADVEAAVTRWVDAGAGPSTIFARHRTLGAILRDAQSNGLTPWVATTGVKLPTIAERTDAFLTPAQVEALIASAARLGTAWAAFVLAGVEAGLRWGEVAALTPDAIDGDRLHVRQVVERTGTVRRFTKGGHHRTIRMSLRLRAALRPLAAAVELERGRHALIFTAPDGGALDYNNYRHRVWCRIRGNATGMRQSGARFHDLRHTFGCRMAARGVPEEAIAAVMGHSDIKVTRKYTAAAGRTVADAWVAHVLDGAASPLAGVS
jgi:integrase